MSSMIGVVRWLQPQDWGVYTSYVDYLDALTAREICPEGAPIFTLGENMGVSPRIL